MVLASCTELTSAPDATDIPRTRFTLSPHTVASLVMLQFAGKRYRHTSSLTTKTVRDVATSLGDFTGTGAYMPVSLANFQVDCGCNSTTYSGTTTPSPGSGSQENIQSTSTPSAGNGRPTPAPTFQPFAVDRLSTSAAAPCTSVPFSALEMVAIFTMVRFVHHLVWGC